MKPIQFFRSFVVKFVELSGFPPFLKAPISNFVWAAKYFRKNTKKWIQPCSTDVIAHSFIQFLGQTVIMNLITSNFRSDIYDVMIVSY